MNCEIPRFEKMQNKKLWYENEVGSIRKEVVKREYRDFTTVKGLELSKIPLLKTTTSKTRSSLREHTR